MNGKKLGFILDYSSIQASISLLASINVGAQRPTNIPNISSSPIKYRYNDPTTENILATNPIFAICPLIINYLGHY